MGEELQYKNLHRKRRISVAQFSSPKAALFWGGFPANPLKEKDVASLAQISSPEVHKSLHLFWVIH
jgi:hypothetical protein